MGERRPQTATDFYDMIEDMIENAPPSELRCPRHWIFALGGILVGWLAFWELCERNPDSPHAQLMAWVFIGFAVYIVYNY